jgi:hypothetical protein
MYTSHELEHNQITEMGPARVIPEIRKIPLSAPICFLHLYKGVHVYYVTFRHCLTD